MSVTFAKDCQQKYFFALIYSFWQALPKFLTGLRKQNSVFRSIVSVGLRGENLHRKRKISKKTIFRAHKFFRKSIYRCLSEAPLEGSLKVAHSLRCDQHFASLRSFAFNVNVNWKYLTEDEMRTADHDHIIRLNGCRESLGKEISLLWTIPFNLLEPIQ